MSAHCIARLRLRSTGRVGPSWAGRVRHPGFAWLRPVVLRLRLVGLTGGSVALANKCFQLTRQALSCEERCSARS